MSNYDVKLLKHQQQLIELPWQYPELEAVFMIAGYSAGKSFSLVAFMIAMSARYNGHPMVCGFGSPTISFARKTVIADLERTLISSKTPYRYNSQTNELTIGTVKWIIFPLDNPKLIFGWNFSVTITDENDELPQDKCIEAFGAVQERTRILLPDGRKPFSIAVSTAQGLKGLFQITENLKDKKIPFAIIRGNTKDNTNLPKEYYDRLFALYTENERAVFLRGEFRNLTSGRVYPGYDESTCMVEPFEITEDDIIHVGVDLNIAASCATAIVKRNKILYCVFEWQFKDFGQAAKLIRQQFPVNRILLYPDASGKMIINGYLAEFAQNNIELRVSPSNPPVIERIFLVNKVLSTGIMKVFRGCKNLDMAWKTRVYTESGDPFKSKVHPAADDQNDSHEYSTFRILSEDPDYFSLYSLTRAYQRSK